MSYFNQILGGNIPLSVIESIEGFQSDFRLNTDNKYFNLNENMTEVGNPHINIGSLLNSSYGNHIKTSLELDREKVFVGIRNILNNATNDAFARNKLDLVKVSKLTTENQKMLNNVIKQVSYDLSNSVIISFNNLKMLEDTKEVLMNIVHLTGITNKSQSEMNDIEKRTSFLLELHNYYKTNVKVNINELLLKQLSLSNIKKCEKNMTHDCLFNKTFIDKLSREFLDSLENILTNSMNSAKHDKMCYFYSFTIELLNALVGNSNKVVEKFGGCNASTGNTYKQNVTEHFGVTIGNTDINTDSTKIKDMKEIEKNIDQSKVISGMTKLISGAINKATSKNQADLLRTMAISNKINVDGVKGSSFTFSGGKQISTLESKVNGNFVQSIKNKVINDIANSLKEQVDIIQKDSIKEMNKTSVDEKTSTSVGEVLTGLAKVAGETIGKLADTAKDILSVNIGNKTEKKTEKEISQELKDKFNLNQSFKYQKDDDVKNTLENLLSSENLSKCANESNLTNEANFRKIDVSGPILISDFQQQNIVKDVMECVFNQEVLNDISNKIVTSQEKLIKQLIESVSDKLTDVEKKKVQGDIYAAGAAGAAILAGAGKAAKDVGEGVATGAKGVGEGVATGAKGVGEGVATGAKGIGEGIGSALAGLVTPLIIAGVVLVVLIIGFMILKKMMADKPAASSDDE